MHQVNDAEKAAKSGDNHSDKSEPLTKRDVAGGVLLIIFVVGALSGYYAYNHISKDSARMQFWIGFMFSFIGVVIVTLQVVIYAQQARFMKQHIELMVLTELPYMRIGSWKPPRICENGRLHVDARLRNSGRTIAWDVIAGCRLIEIGTRPPVKLPLIPTGENTWNAYGAIDTTESMVITFKPLKVTGEQAGKLQEGKIDVFVDGVCRYLHSMGGKSYYTNGFTINFKRNITPRYERHHRVKQANPD